MKKSASYPVIVLFALDVLFVFGGEMIDMSGLLVAYPDGFAESFETFSGTWKIAGNLQNRRSFAAAQVFKG